MRISPCRCPNAESVHKRPQRITARAREGFEERGAEWFPFNSGIFAGTRNEYWVEFARRKPAKTKNTTGIVGISVLRLTNRRAMHGPVYGCSLQPYNSGLPEPRRAKAFDLDLWKQWEGHRVDDVFPLERCLGGTGSSAVFETQFQNQPAAIKIVLGTPGASAALLATWEIVAKLSHPNLVKTYAGGETLFGDSPCAYLVTERADDTLAAVLAERPLTPEETREMLTPVLSALRFLHSNNFAHGSLTASNVMAFGEQLKISTDNAVSGGDIAADSSAVGVLLEQALGGDPSVALPEPFGEIARNCRNPDPAARWDVERMEAHLRGEPARPARSGRSRNQWLGLAAAAAVILGLVAIWPSRDRGTTPDSASQTPSANAQLPAQAETPPASPAAGVAPRAKTTARPAQTNLEPSTQPAGVTPDGIMQVMPKIPQAALNTINGRVRINVRVRVDAEGKVSQATLEPPPASKYFTDRVLAAAESWKFPSGTASREWVLHFELLRDQTRVSLTRTAAQ